jgi:pimeloyl-ACP methyl ester carboxylesterase
MFKHKGKRPMRWILPFVVVCGFTISSSALAQYDPPATIVPTAEVLKEIETKTAKLAARIDGLRKDKKTHELLPDVEIYLRGAVNIVRFKEFYHKDSGKWTLDALDRGLERADQLAKGETPWTKLATRNVLRAYRSGVDGTAQPYGVTYPLDYGKDPKKTWRVDVVLHGRDSKLTEMAFINRHDGKRKPAAEQDWVQIDIFGRGNNAYRWAGETDVLAATEAFFAREKEEKRGNLPDRRKVVLRGFSMGGAGTWHLGLHHPDKWCVMGPGAGFTTTHGYAWKGKKALPEYQERCLRIYDAVDYAENARMVPIIAYSGGDDSQKLAADNIENRLKVLKIGGMTHLVAPGLGHTMPAEWFKKANELWSKHANAGRPPALWYDGKVKLSFVTYSTKFASSEIIWIRGLERHYEKAVVEVDTTIDRWRITTRNVRELGIMPRNVKIDEQDIDYPAPTNESLAGYMLVKREMRWTLQSNLKRDSTALQKKPGLQGPIDDAFAQPFVCVVGSGDTWHPSTKKHVAAKLAAFKYDWGNHWRGELPTTGDYAVTPNDINEKNLILFGDPSSNLTLAQILPKLPLKWTKDEIEFAGKKYKASEHVPVMIFPNPLNPSKYVVLNTGHTWPSEDYAKSNAFLYPRLGDYAILRMTPTATDAAAYEVATAGLFSEFWQVEKK